MDISEATLNKWKLEHASFSESLRKAKEIIDEKVISSLFKSANGGKKKTVVRKPVYDEFLDEEKMVVVQEVEEDVLPNATACFFWLKNRDPDRWKDKRESEVVIKDAEKLTYDQLMQKIEDLKKEVSE